MLESLALQCDNQHKHKSWRPSLVDGRMVFPTAEEAAYPRLLCDRLASLFVQESIERGFKPVESLHEQLQADIDCGKRNLFSYQSRGTSLKPLVPEWGATRIVLVPVTAVPDSKVLAHFPKGSQIIRRFLWRGFKRDEWKSAMLIETIPPDCPFEALTVGVPLNPEDFLVAAVKAGHPKHSFARVDDHMLGVIKTVFLEEKHVVLGKSIQENPRRQKSSVVERDVGGPQVPGRWHH